MSWSSHDAPDVQTQVADVDGSSRRRRCQGLRAVLLLGGLAFTQPAATAVKYSFATEAGLQGLDNPFLLPGKDRGAVLTEIAVNPTLTVSDNSGGSSLDIGGTATGRAYSQHYGQFLLGDAHVTGVVRRNEYLTLNASGSFQRSLSADALVVDVDAAADPASVRSTVAALASLAWTPTAGDTVTPQFNFEHSSYGGSAVLRGTSTTTGDLEYARRLSERTSIGAGARAAANRSGAAQFDTLAVFATLDRRFSSRLRLTGEAGAQRNHDRSPGPHRNRLGFAGRGGLCLEERLLTACLNGAMTSEISALGFLQRRYSVGGSATRRLGPGLSAGLAADYSRSNREQGIAAAAQSAANVRGTIDWQMASSLKLSGEAGYRQRNVGFDVGGGFVGVRLRWQK